MGLFGRKKEDKKEEWYNKGNALKKLERNEEAIVCYDKAIQLNPEYFKAWNNKGDSLKKLDRDEQAKQCFAKAKELDES